MAKRVKWEYRLSTDRNEMAGLGADGWELVSVAVIEGLETFYYKRPAPAMSEQITQEQLERALKRRGLS